MADALASRQGQNDAEYVYAVMKLLHRLGTASADGHKNVQRVRDRWRAVKGKLDQFRRTYGHMPRPQPTPATATAQSGGIGGSGVNRQSNTMMADAVAVPLSSPSSASASSSSFQQGIGAKQDSVMEGTLFKHDPFIMG
jgi:hypothetical protein